MPKVEQLKKHIARAVLIAPDTNPKTGHHYTREIVFTYRPGWSNIEPYAAALPGGKIESQDFTGIESDENLADPHYELTLDQITQAALQTIERELLEELGLTIAPALLHFVDVSTTDTGWTTHTYVAELPEKPALMVKPNSAGTVWMNEQTITQQEPELLNSHLDIARRALKKTS